MGKLTERDLNIRGIRLHMFEEGEGPLVLMLHGFPEFWYQWRRQMPAVADAGFRVIAPDQRGYGQSEKPPRIRDYRVEELATDIVALVRALGEKTATIIGHDWGGIVAYYVAMHCPQSVKRLVILNAPHPAPFDWVLRHSFKQVRRSAYAFFFMIPRLPEAAISRGHWAALRSLFDRRCHLRSFHGRGHWTLRRSLVAAWCN